MITTQQLLSVLTPPPKLQKLVLSQYKQAYLKEDYLH